ncbi:MAG: methyltransferase domain-containing protein [Acidobacteria bacterium]|nr:methyltransferase domain-containing protein [Acidobacteriota bacterium]
MRGFVMERKPLPAKYYYSVWLRHMVKAHEYGLSTQPDVIAELGPGDSLGVGLTALLTGTRKYHALDIVKYADIEHNLTILEELVELLRNRTAIPGPDAFPSCEPKLDSYEFPFQILPEKRLSRALASERIALIKQALQNVNKQCVNKQEDAPVSIMYHVPWEDAFTIEKNVADVVISQAVLEHVDRLENAYAVMHAWLKCGGYISQSVDFRSHGLSKKWNGHWEYSDAIWRLILGGRPYLINRLPLSRHVQLLKKNNFEIKCLLPSKDNSSSIKVSDSFKWLTQEDLETATCFIQAAKTV